MACGWGELEVDDDGRPVRVRAELDLDSLDTGIAKRDADLCKPSLLDIGRRPVMAWTADRFSRGVDGRWTADGVLHLRGTSAPLAVTGIVAAGPDGRVRVRVRASAALDRVAVGIRAPRILIGRGRDRRRRLAQPPLPGVRTAGSTPGPVVVQPTMVRGISGPRSALKRP